MFHFVSNKCRVRHDLLIGDNKSSIIPLSYEAFMCNLLHKKVMKDVFVSQAQKIMRKGRHLHPDDSLNNYEAQTELKWWHNTGEDLFFLSWFWLLHLWVSADATVPFPDNSLHVIKSVHTSDTGICIEQPKIIHNSCSNSSIGEETSQIFESQNPLRTRPILISQTPSKKPLLAFSWYFIQFVEPLRQVL